MAVLPAVQAQALYKYRGDNGEWIFSDRPPPDGSRAEVRELNARLSPWVFVLPDWKSDNLTMRLDALTKASEPPPEPEPPSEPPSPDDQG